MRIIACCKAVPDEESITVLGNGELSFDNISWKISTYDLNAIEAGKKLAAQTGGTLSALSVGGGELKDSKLRKDILSRGPADLNIVVGDTGIKDTLSTARFLKQAVEQFGEYDLILCGTGSADLYAQQTGNQLGVLLGIPVVNGVSGIEAEDGEKTIKVERSLDHEIEVLEIPLPAVLSVTSDINIPSIPGMRDIMGAGKKPVNELQVDWDEICETDISSTLAPKQKERRQEILEGESEEIIDALVAAIRRELV